MAHLLRAEYPRARKVRGGGCRCNVACRSREKSAGLETKRRAHAYAASELRRQRIVSRNDRRIATAASQPGEESQGRGNGKGKREGKRTLLPARRRRQRGIPDR